MSDNYLLPIISFEPAIMDYGRGSYIYDTDGKKYLDLNSGQFCTVLGHCNEELLDSVKTSLGRISHTASNILTKDVVTCAAKIHELSKDMRAYSILLSTGAESVEFALRYAKHIKKKSGIICFEKGYHGLTLGTQSVTFGGKFASPAVSDIFETPVPDSSSGRTEEYCIEEFYQLVRKNKDKTAAVLMEPVVSVGGMLYPSSRYFQAIREICDKNDILLIFDESQTGFGRLGTWFAYEKYDVIPDMVCLAKGIGCGYPVSMVMFRDTLIPENGFQMTHYSSHQNDSFAASVINAGIRYMETHNILHSVSEKGNYFLTALTALCEKNPHVQNPRGIGLMLGADLFFEGVTDYRTIYHQLYEEMMNSGVIIQGTCGGSVLRFLPDYLISEQDIDFAINMLDRVLLSTDFLR